MKLSIIIPAFNEKNTIKEIISRVKAVSLPGIEKEIIVIDDGSTDGTREIVENIKGISYIFHEKNLGKGGAVKTGFQRATGDFVIIQDADLEYEPNDYPRLLEPIITGRADVVWGSRFIGSEPHRVLYFHRYLANKLITNLSNIFTNLNLTDIETGYKLFSKKAVQIILPKLKSKRFGIEVELTSRIAKENFRVCEVAIAYYGRTVEEGKKINWRDGIAALWHIIYFNLFDF